MMKQKTTWRDWFAFLAFGLGAMVVYHAAIVAVALIIGILVDAFSNFEWHFAALVSYFGIRLVMEIPDALSGFQATRCTTCRRKIKTSRPIKCEECGGAAQLVRK